MLDYAEYLESLAARSGGTEVIQNDRKNRDSFYYNKQVEQFLHRAIDEDLFEVYYQPVYSLHQQRFVTLEALQPPAASHTSAGFHRIFLSTLRRRTALSVRSPSFSCGASAVFCVKTRRSARALRTSRSIFRRSILFTAMAETT